MPHWDIAVVGVPFDGGTSYRPGARFGPAAVRQGSRLLRPYHPALDAAALRVGPGGRRRRHRLLAVRQRGGGDPDSGGRRRAARERWAAWSSIGGDHTVALPLLRATAPRHGPLALVHFDAHLDTWDTYFGQRYTHGTPFRRAWEEGLLRRDRSVHVGLRGPLYSTADLIDDAGMGFAQVTTDDVAERRRGRGGGAGAGAGGRRTALRVGRHRRPRPGARARHRHARGRRADQPRAAVAAAGARPAAVVGADVVEVSPAYDHAEITAIAAAHVLYELVTLMALRAA